MSVKKEIESIELHTLKSLRTPHAGKVLAQWLIGIFLVFLVLLFLPWQQNITGKGEVSAFSPENRPQTVETAIAGRIAAWHVQEGTFVQAGDTLLTLTEIKDKYFDPNLLLRIQEQLTAKENSISSKRNKVTALEKQVSALKDAVQIKIQQTQNKLAQTTFKLISDSVDYETEKVRFANAENQFERNKKLYAVGNIALTKFQEVESKFQQGKMKVVSSENKYLQSKAELLNARVEVAGVEAEYLDKISKAESDLNATLSELYEAEAGLSKLRNEFANMQIRNQQYQVVAPQSGYVIKALKQGIGATIKEGEAITRILPQSTDIAVEMYVKAMDVPLIAKGRKVRIEFDGWPALQFSGWPSVTVGTFGGIVKVIDYINSTGGEFRLLVTPDPAEEPWPEQLRLGSGTKGWVMLDTVPLWYELWRQLNGFPPSLYEKPQEEKKESLEAETAKQ